MSPIKLYLIWVNWDTRSYSNSYSFAIQFYLSIQPERQHIGDCLCLWKDALIWAAKVKSESEVSQLCPTLCEPMDCSPPGSSIHEIFQARVLEWVVIFFSRVSSWPRSPTSQADALPSEPPGKPFWAAVQRPNTQTDKNQTICTQQNSDPQSTTINFSNCRLRIFRIWSLTTSFPDYLPLFLFRINQRKP